MEIVAAGPAGPSLVPLLQDYRQRHALCEDVVLDTLIEALSTRQAQALVALKAGHPVGVVILSSSRHEGRIHLLHTLPEAQEAGRALLARAEQELSHEKGIGQISATLSIFPGSALEEMFRQRGYRVIRRARMLLELASFDRAAILPAGYRMASWSARHQRQAAALVAAAHRDMEDTALYPEVVTAAGARRLLERTQGGEFGHFHPALSPMCLTDRALAGLCLAVWHAALPGQGFILDLCVARAHRRRGLGRALVATTAAAFRQAGARSLGLAVTLSNQPAWQLYEGMGFSVEQHFTVFQREIGA